MRKCVGFTVIELLVVVAILGLLAAILLPSLLHVRTQANRAACATNLRQVGLALRAYLSETNDRLPAVSYLPSMSPAPLDGEAPISIADVLGPYVDDQVDVFRCPRDRGFYERPEPNVGRTYFASEGSSYEFRTRVNGLVLSQHLAEIAQRMKQVVPENMFWLMRDYANFHGEAGTEGSRRYLYEDGHVTDFEQF